MKVLHVMPSFYPAHVYGGPIQSVYALCRHLSRAGCEVSVLTTNANGRERILDVRTDRQVELEDGVRVRYCRRHGSGSCSPQLVGRLAAEIAGADIVHVTAVYSFPVIPALLAARAARKPVVWSPRGSLTGWKQRSRGRLKRCWEAVCEVSRPRTVVLHVTSEDEARDARACFPRVQSVVIANGVERSELATHPAPGRTLRMLYLGRLHAVKGLENLVEACARVRAGLDFQLTIVGGGEPEFVRRLSQRAREAGVADRVRMTGELAGHPKESAFADSDLLVLPSHSENFGMAIAEALARGIPVIASRQTPWARVEEVGCGLWVDNDPESLAKALVRAASMPLRDMGARGRAWMRAEFGWPARAARMLQLYQSMVSAPDHAAAVAGGHQTA